MDVSIIELEHSILNGWIANNFHSYINNAEESRESAMEINAYNASMREAELERTIEKYRSIIEKERTDKMFLVKQLEDKDAVIRQLQTQLTNQRASQATSHITTNQSVKATIEEKLTPSTVDLSKEFKVFESEIKSLLNQNKKLKQKSKQSPSSKHDEKRNSSECSAESKQQQQQQQLVQNFELVREMLEIQEKIEEKLTQELSSLKDTVAQQQEILTEWEPIIAQVQATQQRHRKHPPRQSESSHHSRSSYQHQSNNTTVYKPTSQHSDCAEQEQEHKHCSATVERTINDKGDHKGAKELKGGRSNVSLLNEVIRQHDQDQYHHHSDCVTHCSVNENTAARGAMRRTTDSDRQPRYTSPLPTIGTCSTSSPSAGSFSPQNIRHDLDRLLSEIGCMDLATAATAATSNSTRHMTTTTTDSSRFKRNQPEQRNNAHHTAGVSMNDEALDVTQDIAVSPVCDNKAYTDKVRSSYGNPERAYDVLSSGSSSTGDSGRHRTKYGAK